MYSRRKILILKLRTNYLKFKILIKLTVNWINRNSRKFELIGLSSTKRITSEQINFGKSSIWIKKWLRNNKKIKIRNWIKRKWE